MFFYSHNLCLLVDVFTQFTFKIIGNMLASKYAIYHLFSISFLWFLFLWFLFLAFLWFSRILQRLQLDVFIVFVNVYLWSFLFVFVFVALSITVHACDITIYWHQHFTTLSEVQKPHIGLCAFTLPPFKYHFLSII